MTKKSSYEDLQKGIRELKTPSIEVWENKYSDRRTTVDLETPEFTCVCPKTGQPDFASIHIIYTPYLSCIELKSFKMYLQFYREIGIFHEHLVQKIADDFVAACDPIDVIIEVVMNPRGGIATTVSASYQRKDRNKK